MPYDFIIGNKSNYSIDQSKNNYTYQESMRKKLSMNPKSLSQYTPPSYQREIYYDLPSVKIGTQIWTSQNLSVDRYSNGDLIQQVTNAAQLDNLTTGAWCYFNNDPATGAIYGKLYNWYAITDPRGIAPSGWRVPNDNDFNTLINFVPSGGTLKEVGTAHWYSPNTGATDDYGFTALPAGVGGYGAFTGRGFNGYFWSTTEFDIDNANFIGLSYSNDLIQSAFDLKTSAVSIRLIKN